MNYLLLLVIGTILCIFFLINGLYGLMSGRVYGRTWEKYWGGWVYKTQNPVYYWSYVFMHLFVATVLAVSCAVLW